MTYNVIIICHKTIKNVHHTFYPDVLYMIPHVSFEEGSGICFRRIVFFQIPRFISFLEELIRVRVSYVQHFNDRGMTLDS